MKSRHPEPRRVWTMNIIRPIFGFLIIMELGDFKQANKDATGSAKIFHCGELHAENFYFG